MALVGPGSFIRGLADFINGIPVIGDITAAIDRSANYIDPAQILATKVFGMDEDIATDYAHHAGIIAAFYGLGELLGGAEAGVAASATEASGAELAPLSSYIMGGAEEVGGLTGAEIAAGSSTAAGSSLSGELAPLSSYLAGGSEVAPIGSEAVAASTVPGELAPLSSYTFGNTPQLTVAEKLLANKQLINYISKAGKFISPEQQQSPVYGGTSSTRVNQPLPEQDVNKMMNETLSSDQSSKMFSDKESALSNREQNALYKSFLAGENKSSLTSTKVGGDLAIKSRVSKKRSKSTGLKSVSVASPFYQQDEEF
jgi:hypothetical protein